MPGEKGSVQLRERGRRGGRGEKYICADARINLATSYNVVFLSFIQMINNRYDQGK